MNADSMAGKVTLCMKIVGNNDEYNGYKQYFLHNRVSDLKVKLMDVLSLFLLVQSYNAFYA